MQSKELWEPGGTEPSILKTGPEEVSSESVADARAERPSLMLLLQDFG